MCEKQHLTAYARASFRERWIRYVLFRNMIFWYDFSLNEVTETRYFVTSLDSSPFYLCRVSRAGVCYLLETEETTDASRIDVDLQAHPRATLFVAEMNTC